MSSFASECLQTLEDTTLSNSTRFLNTILCPYDTAFSLPALPSVGGIDIFLFLIGLTALTGIQLRTKSFAFTALVLLVCGGSMLAYFPAAWIKIGFTLAMLAFAGVLLKIYQDQQG